jgi:ribosomal protein S18 acetylase RimI-like enzyme
VTAGIASVLRPAQKSDYQRLHQFSSALTYLHRHLDWRDALEWLGRAPFWLLEEDGDVQAALACPPEPAWVAWVRLFAVDAHTSPDRAWKKLFERCLDDLRRLDPMPVITSLAMRDWYEDLLRRNGFEHHQDIVVFLFDEQPPGPIRMAPGCRLREMLPGDLPGVTAIDHLAFEPIWRLSADDLAFAVKKSSYCTVVEQEGEIIGYQMSSSSGIYAHLARLAVHPGLQRRRIGFVMVQDLLDHFLNRSNFWGVTLNTQHNNSASIALYQRIGFRETGERFPVFTFREGSS